MRNLASYRAKRGAYLRRTARFLLPLRPSPCVLLLSSASGSAWAAFQRPAGSGHIRDPPFMALGCPLQLTMGEPPLVSVPIPLGPPKASPARKERYSLLLDSPQGALSPQASGVWGPSARARCPSAPPPQPRSPGVPCRGCGRLGRFQPASVAPAGVTFEKKKNK